MKTDSLVKVWTDNMIRGNLNILLKKIRLEQNKDTYRTRATKIEIARESRSQR